ncbi:MAG: pyridoxamine 5'-phosphate oxidase family protein [Agarilytica sp.]
MLTEEIKNAIQESVLCWLATTDENGCPNVSPKEMFLAHEDTKLLIANIASPESVSNIRVNPNVCVSMIHVFKQKGFKLKGRARIVERNDTGYQLLEDKLYTLGGKDFEIKSIFEITLTEAKPIIAPSYWLFPNTTESSQIEQSMKTYGVFKST